MSEKEKFTIGEFMQKSGVSIRTLRYYDSIDLLKPSDYTEGGHRLYSSDKLFALQKIKSLQFLGFSLKDIKSMFQENVAKGSEVLKLLNEQKQIFEAKRLEITNILSDLDHLVETIDDEETVNINTFCAMLQKLMFEEDTKKWFEYNFTKDINDELFGITKSEEVNLDKKWSKVLTEIKHLALTEVMPSSEKSQLTIKSLMEIMNETTKGNLDLIVKELPSSESFSFPNPFTKKEDVFLKEAMQFYKEDNSGFK